LVLSGERQISDTPTWAVVWGVWVRN